MESSSEKIRAENTSSVTSMLDELSWETLKSNSKDQTPTYQPVQDPTQPY